MKLLGNSKILVNRSKFFGYFFEVSSEEDFLYALEFVRGEHPKARHVCSGAVFEDEEIFKNDSEVGNPGKALLEILKQKGFSSNALIVARYFGGVKLGPAGVGKAFRNCGEDAISST